MPESARQVAPRTYVTRDAWSLLVLTGDRAGDRAPEGRSRHANVLAQGGEGDALNAVLCAAGSNIRWLLRAIARLGLRTLLLALIEWPPHAASTPTARTRLLRRFGAVVHQLAQRLTTRRQLPAAIGR